MSTALAFKSSFIQLLHLHSYALSRKTHRSRFAIDCFNWLFSIKCIHYLHICEDLRTIYIIIIGQFGCASVSRARAGQARPRPAHSAGSARAKPQSRVHDFGSF